jgi:predicted nucleic acid-binding protein
MTTDVYFIDTNVFLYSVGRDHPMKAPCQKAIEDIRDGVIQAVINTEVIQEIVYRFQAIRELGHGVRLAQEVISISSRILSVTDEDCSIALELLDKGLKIQTRDAFHAATMINNAIQRILSVDRHFDSIPGIERTDPRNLK